MGTSDSSDSKERAEHWQRRYESTTAEQLGWYRPHLDASHALIRAAAGGRPETRILDVGGGASSLVDDLLVDGFCHLTVLDLAPAGLDVARNRLGQAAATVTWKVADILSAELAAAAFDLWHDRAVFHFLTSQAARQAYVAQLRHAVVPAGYLVIGTFAPEAPPRCSGLPVQRYAPDELEAEFAPWFRPLRRLREDHRTPGGTAQPYAYALLEHVPGS